jgi:hypothetical protein
MVHSTVRVGLKYSLRNVSPPEDKQEWVKKWVSTTDMREASAKEVLRFIRLAKAFRRSVSRMKPA